MEIPYAASLILKHDLHGVVPASNAAPPNDWPVVPIVFFAFRIMVGLGVLMLALGWIGAVLLWRSRTIPPGSCIGPCG